MKNGIKKYVGDREFYHRVVALVIPLVVQQGITSFVNLLDNVMVGGLGTNAISAVAIVNQLIMVFNLTIFGGLSGASIFGAQFFGNKDNKGLRNTFRFKLIFGFVTTVIAVLILYIYGRQLAGLFMGSSSNDASAVNETMNLVMDYMKVALIGLFPFMVVQTYAGTLRETGETVAPMIAGIISFSINLVFNYLLIYGTFGFPRLGVTGAAIATVLSRFVEMTYVVVYTHRNHVKYPFIENVFKGFSVPKTLAVRIIKTGSPLMFNEMLWSLGMTAINQNYSTRGLDVIAAVNITSTAWQLFTLVMFAMGNAVAILVGQCLGAGETEEAKDIDRKLIALTVVANIVIGFILILVAPLIPLIYNVEPGVRELTASLLRIAGIAIPMNAFIHATYFTIRSGGKTIITFFFDCVYTWCVPVVLSFILCRFTDMPVIWVYFCVTFIDIIKVIIGTIMLRNGFWAHNVIKEEEIIEGSEKE
jgi:putative MATE family efflux protein